MYQDEIKIEKELQKIVLAALTGPEYLKEASSALMEKYGVSVDPEPTVLEIARETQSLSMEIESISEEIRDVRLKTILKRIAMIVPQDEIIEKESVETEVVGRLSSLGELN